MVEPAAVHSTQPAISVERLLIHMPTWLGDCVMATPTLRALRELYPQAHVSVLVKSPMKPMLDGMPWIDRVLTLRSTRSSLTTNSRRGICATASRLKSGQFDLAVLLPNSFRSALTMALARIPRRVGYERDWRGMFLTDELKPKRQGLGFQPVPTLVYYLKLAEYLGAPTDADRTMALFTREQDDVHASRLLADAGYDAQAGQPLVLLNPGANRLDKRWSPARFGQVAQACVCHFGAKVAVTGAPREREVVQQVVDAAGPGTINLLDCGMTLRLLKSMVKCSSLMVTNDTGPRHIAAAMHVPVVTLFGPTAPAWTTLDFPNEREIHAESSRIDDIEVDQVMQAVEQLWQTNVASASSGTGS